MVYSVSFLQTVGLHRFKIAFLKCVHIDTCRSGPFIYTRNSSSDTQSTSSIIDSILYKRAHSGFYKTQADPISALSLPSSHGGIRRTGPQVWPLSCWPHGAPGCSPSGFPEQIQLDSSEGPPCCLFLLPVTWPTDASSQVPAGTSCPQGSPTWSQSGSRARHHQLRFLFPPRRSLWLVIPLGSVHHPNACPPPPSGDPEPRGWAQPGLAAF